MTSYSCSLRSSTQRDLLSVTLSKQIWGSSCHSCLYLAIRHDCGKERLQKQTQSLERTYYQQFSCPFPVSLGHARLHERSESVAVRQDVLRYHEVQDAERVCYIPLHRIPCMWELDDSNVASMSAVWRNHASHLTQCSVVGNCDGRFVRLICNISLL